MPDGNPYLSSSIAPAIAQPVPARTFWGNLLELALTFTVSVCVLVFFIAGVVAIARVDQGSGLFWLWVALWTLVFCGAYSYVGRYYRRLVLNLRVGVIGDAIAYNNRGAERLNRGECKLARDDLEKALEQDPKLAVAYFNRGMVNGLEGRWSQAIEDATQSIELDPKFVRSYVLRALAFNWIGNFDAAIEDCNIGVALDPRHSDFYAHRGYAFSQKLQLSNAMSDANEAIRLAPKNADAHVTRANVWLAQKEFDRAEADAREAKRLNRSSTPAHTVLASVAMNKGNLDAALEHIGQALQLTPHDTHALSIRTAINSERHDFAAVINDCDHLVAVDPQAMHAYTTRGLAKHRLGRLEEGLADYSVAIQIGGETPASAIAYNNRGYTYHALRQYAAAVSAFEHAMQLDPNHPNAFKNLGWLLATCPDSVFRDGPRALELGTRAQELTGWQQIGWFSILAAAYAESGDYENATKLQQQVIESNLPVNQTLERTRLQHYQQCQPWRQPEP